MQTKTKKRVQKILDQTGHTLSLSDVEDILQLDGYAAKINGELNDIERVRDHFQIGGKWFSRPSYAQMALIEKIEEVYDYDIWRFIGWLYALDVERTEDELKGCPSRSQLAKYRFKIRAPQAEVARKLEEVFAKDAEDSEDREGEKDTEWKVCSILSREIGGSPDEWYHASPGKITAAASAMEEKFKQEVASMRKSGASGGAPPVTPKMYAIKAFEDKALALEVMWSDI